MLPQSHKNHARRGDIVDWKYLPAVPFEQFRQRQARLLAKGWRVVFDAITSGNPCPVCGCDQRVFIETAYFVDGRDVDSFAVDLCLCCWSAVEGIPIYEGDVS